MADLGIEDSTVGALMVSIFIFAYAVGPLILSPISETHGRAPVQHVGNVVFMAFSLGGGFAETVDSPHIHQKSFAQASNLLRPPNSRSADSSLVLAGRLLSLLSEALLRTFGTRKRGPRFKA